MDRQKAVAKDLLASIPSTIDAPPAQSQPPPKPKRIKKAQPKAKATQVDTKDTLPISKLASSERTTSAAEKRPAEAQPSQSPRSKKPRSSATSTSGSRWQDSPWAPQITLEDKPVMTSHSVDDTNAEAAIKAKDDADEKAGAAEAINKVLEAQRKESEEKMAQAQQELRDALATKDAEIKAVDEKGYNKGVADVTADYEKQVKNTDVLPLLFPQTPPQSEDESEFEEETLVRRSKEAAGTKSLSQNEQVLDLTQDEECEKVPKDASPEKSLFVANVPFFCINTTSFSE
ncbi:uncharacterized protein LOC114272723 [Camellia sinensis]|uniref:uncharacterized protein LOC114272723 n=1 Tax=Camellia sinensis TaxID=4442 RepID=UPI001036A49C|nr:uncharacterized protein LOC114272723 [Camellia sinensis]